MINCPACQNQELVGALFCSACGTQLSYQTKTPPETIIYTKSRLPFDNEAKTRLVEPVEKPSAHVLIKISQSGSIIPLEGSQDFTIGRVSGTQPILPDIDLTPFQAYEGGVSRLHATLRITDEEVVLSDLGSANGTRINGAKIPAYTPQRLVNGDRVTLGKFQIEIIINDAE
jgi:pSer/pThr/pTyr-binding forkhead associated (FHA) protein